VNSTTGASSFAGDEREHAVEVHALRERALRARLDDRAVRERIRERHADLDHVRARRRDPAHQHERSVEVGMSRGDVHDQRAPAGGLQRAEARGDRVRRSSR